MGGKSEWGTGTSGEQEPGCDKCSNSSVIESSGIQLHLKKEKTFRRSDRGSDNRAPEFKFHSLETLCIAL